MEGLGDYQKIIDKEIDKAKAAGLADGVYMIIFLEFTMVQIS